MQAEARPDPWILRPRPNPRAALRLFCFPYAGGGASIFDQLVRRPDLAAHRARLVAATSMYHVGAPS